MTKTKIRRFIYHVKHRYLTLNTIVIVVAFMIAAGWAWGSVNVMQKNYTLQRELADKRQKLRLVSLQTENLNYEQQYYKTPEYQELAVREALGYGDKGESVLILPPNSQPPARDGKTAAQQQVAYEQPSNLQQWVNFLFGGDARRLK